MVRDCEEIDFPQVRHDFSDTKIYWRKTADAAVVSDSTKELDTTKEADQVKE
jgi:hypothetical protein